MEKEKNCKIVEEIYLELNKKYGLEEIYTEGFTSEQVYYQVEGLINRVLEEKEKEVKKLYKKFLTVCVTENETKEEELDNEIIDELDNEIVEELDSEIVEELDSENDHFDDDDSEAFENYKKDLEETEEDTEDEEDDDTFSDEGSIEDLEELKDMPASDLFKRLDKNIKK